MAKKSFAHALGDKIERLGERITKSGANKLGARVYRLGNRIEHINSKKK